jgi:acyl-CoA synthetase (AMP-forming)/AMP-acid ligase II
MPVLFRDAPRHPPAAALPFATVLDALDHTAAGCAGGVRLLGADRVGERRSFAAIAALSAELAGKLAARGVGAGDRVVLAMDTSFELIATLFAVQRLGAIPVPTYPPSVLERADRAAERLRSVAASARPALIVTQAAIAPSLAGVTDEAPPVAVEALLGGPSAAWQPARATPDAPAFLQYTSGSTRAPLGAAISHRAALAQIAAGLGAMRVTPADINVSWLPLYHDMGLVWGLLWPVCTGIELVLMSPLVFLWDPMRWLQAIGDFGGTITCGPNFAFARVARRVRPDALAGVDLGSVRLIISGGERVTRAACDGFAAALAPWGLRGDLVKNGYGLAEMTLACAGTPLAERLAFARLDPEALAAGRAVRSSAPDAVEIACAGPPLPGYGVKITGADGDELPERAVGDILLTGPSRMTGYHGDEAATAAVVSGDWLATGDVGYLDGGELYVTGRAKEVIIVRGRTLHPVDAEEHLEALPGARRGGCVALALRAPGDDTDGVGIVCETALGDPAARAALVDAITATATDWFGVRPAAVRLIAPGALPRTSSGKKQRHAARALL